MSHEHFCIVRGHAKQLQKANCGVLRVNYRTRLKGDMDRVFIHDLHLRGKHGVGEAERSVEQEFLVDIEAEFDARPSAHSDKIEDTIDYARFREIAREAVEQNSFYLIEKLAETIAQQILSDTRVQKVCITVRKPAVFKDCIPGITIVRTRA